MRIVPPAAFRGIKATMELQTPRARTMNIIRTALKYTEKNRALSRAEEGADAQPKTVAGVIAEPY
jgi:hypothetical protein